ncbi:hypothetical protein [Larkinella rosea]|uniref:Uncharacterized protein n=1 Tax=Larkinella rosea TaxID=2025312 RepID=A0A3P1BDA2_9BACT|nr:hypothetical protein [Larkinella rosea]RRA99107.1 hypothetical protein EHT25_29475 [Larkinella rosea]
MWLVKTGSVCAQETATTGSTFPNRYTGRQIVVEVGSETDRPEYRLLDNGLMYYREGAEGGFTQLGQQKKDTTQRAFATLEQECKIKTTKLDKPEKPDVTITWKRAKTEFAVGWEKRNAPEVYERFYEKFMSFFPKTKKK